MGDRYRGLIQHDSYWFANTLTVASARRCRRGPQGDGSFELRFLSRRIALFHFVGSIFHLDAYHALLLTASSRFRFLVLLLSLLRTLAVVADVAVLRRHRRRRASGAFYLMPVTPNRFS